MRNGLFEVGVRVAENCMALFFAGEKLSDVYLGFE